eukprot:408416-Pleurochrysis_carterae.AAC.2
MKGMRGKFRRHSEVFGGTERVSRGNMRYQKIPTGLRRLAAVFRMYRGVFVCPSRFTRSKQRGTPKRALSSEPPKTMSCSSLTSTAPLPLDFTTGGERATAPWYLRNRCGFVFPTDTVPCTMDKLL